MQAEEEEAAATLPVPLPAIPPPLLFLQQQLRSPPLQKEKLPQVPLVNQLLWDQFWLTTLKLQTELLKNSCNCTTISPAQATSNGREVAALEPWHHSCLCSLGDTSSGWRQQGAWHCTALQMGGRQRPWNPGQEGTAMLFPFALSQPLLDLGKYLIRGKHASHSLHSVTACGP